MEEKELGMKEKKLIGNEEEKKEKQKNTKQLLYFCLFQLKKNLFFNERHFKIVGIYFKTQTFVRFN